MTRLTWIRATRAGRESAIKIDERVFSGAKKRDFAEAYLHSIILFEGIVL